MHGVVEQIILYLQVIHTMATCALGYMTYTLWLCSCSLSCLHILFHPFCPHQILECEWQDVISIWPIALRRFTSTER